MIMTLRVLVGGRICFKQITTAETSQNVARYQLAIADGLRTLRSVPRHGDKNGPDMSVVVSIDVAGDNGFHSDTTQSFLAPADAVSYNAIEDAIMAGLKKAGEQI